MGLRELSNQLVGLTKGKPTCFDQAFSKRLFESRLQGPQPCVIAALYYNIAYPSYTIAPYCIRENDFFYKKLFETRNGIF